MIFRVFFPLTNHGFSSKTKYKWQEVGKRNWFWIYPFSQQHFETFSINLVAHVHLYLIIFLASCIPVSLWCWIHVPYIWHLTLVLRETLLLNESLYCICCKWGGRGCLCVRGADGQCAVSAVVISMSCRGVTRACHGAWEPQRSHVIPPAHPL